MHFSRLQLAHCNIEDRWEEDERDRVGGQPILPYESRTWYDWLRRYPVVTMITVILTMLHRC